MIDGLLIAIVEAERRDSSTQNFHWRSLLWERFQQVDNLRRQLASLREALCEDVQLRRIRQRAVPKEVGCLLKRGLRRQFVNIDAAIGKHAGIAIDPADAGVGCNNAFESLCSYRSCHT